ncbi:MAG TPA: hypothetical protein PKV98_04635 [Burkholderiaceae bacterium]|nr:hypothetical protein [Burkholderiaceae bacterium]
MSSSLPKARVSPVKPRLTNIDLARLDARLESEIKRIDERIDTLREGQVEIHRLLHENTEITRSMVGKIDVHISRTEPLVSSYEGMQAGIKAMGKLSTAATFCGKLVLFVTAGWLALKVFAHGDGVQAAVAEFWRAVSGAK